MREAKKVLNKNTDLPNDKNDERADRRWDHSETEYCSEQAASSRYYRISEKSCFKGTSSLRDPKQTLQFMEWILFLI